MKYFVQNLQFLATVVQLLIMYHQKQFKLDPLRVDLENNTQHLASINLPNNHYHDIERDYIMLFKERTINGCLKLVSHPFVILQ